MVEDLSSVPLLSRFSLSGMVWHIGALQWHTRGKLQL